MTIGGRTIPARRVLVGTACCAAALAAVLATVGASGQAGAATGPDVTVFAFTDVGNYGSSGGFVGYSIGTRSCNRGDVPLNWCDQASGCAPGAGIADHPAIAQNLYRLKNGRFDQVGLSWLKHGFTSTNSSTAGCAGASGQSCSQPPAGGNQLGVGCTDPYVSSLNGTRPLGKRSEVNGTTGAFPFPYTQVGASTVYDQRVKVAVSDVDPASNSGALYFAEGQYVSKDDAAAGNSLNNASYRRVTLGTAPNYSLSLTGTFFEKQPAIFAWKAADPLVTMAAVDVPGAIVQRFNVARKVTDLGGGQWHYEYAIHNMNSDRGARAFTVELPNAAVFTNAGFKSPAYHSGETYSSAAWTVSTTAHSITWSTSAFADDANANALRFATVYNFWFDADQQPTNAIDHTLGLFKDGDPASVGFPMVETLLADSFETGDLTTWSAGSNIATRGR
jgi:hypothetical protein